ncbi:ion channel [Kitasatospora sp. NPDC088391]|uniref:ion channel n=1 Tax=Kitasatospora sp. NPDC088391 TaxID=3364074 RepID=UPI003826AAFF
MIRHLIHSPRLGRASVFLIINSLSCVALAFSQTYWMLGTKDNFSEQLTKLDAVYFALGTMTTGTGSLAPLSAQARGVVTVQMVIDFLLIAVAATILVSRLSENREDRVSPSESEP